MIRVAAESSLFIESTIVESPFLDARVKQEEFTGSHHVAAIFVCSTNAWCNAVCRLPSSKVVLTDLHVSGGVSIGTQVTCWTVRPRALFPNPNAIITGRNPSNSENTVDNLELGYYFLLGSLCYFSKHTDLHIPLYLVVEFPSIVKVTSVTVRNYHKYQIGNHFMNFEVRVGNFSEPSDFPQNQHLGTILAKDMQAHDMDFTVTSKQPIYGKYVSFLDHEAV